MKLVIVLSFMVCNIVYGQEMIHKIDLNDRGLTPIITPYPNSKKNLDSTSSIFISYEIDSIVPTNNKIENKKYTSHIPKKALSLSEYKQFIQSNFNISTKKNNDDE